MLNVSYSANAIVFTNSKTNKAEELALFAEIDSLEAIRTINQEIKHRASVSQSAVSLLCHILDNPRLDAYKGTTPITASVPKELKQAIRDLETEYLKPIFCKPLEEKGAKPATVEKQWQDFATGLRDGGGYANAKSRVVALFAHCGKLPKHEGMLLSVAAVDKLLQIEKANTEKPVDTGIAGKLVALASDIESRNEETNLGDVDSAVAALKSMLASFEGLQREALEKASAEKAEFDVSAFVNALLSDLDGGKVTQEQVKTTLQEKAIEYVVDGEGDIIEIVIE